MKNILSQVLALAPDWVAASFPIIRIVLVCIMALCAICMTVAILMQSNSNDDATSALTGHVQESYYAQNKGESKNVRLSRATLTLICIIAVCIVLYFVSLIIYQG